MNPGTPSEIIKILREHTNDYLSKIEGWQPFWNSKKSDSEWTVGEVAEHTMLVEAGVIKLLQSPSEKQHDTRERFGLPKMRQYLVQGRQMAKVKAPEPFHPKGTIDPESFSKAFRKQRDYLISALETGEILVDNRMYKHPFLGDLTVSDWLYSVITHAERHEAQIQEILEVNT